VTADINEFRTTNFKLRYDRLRGQNTHIIKFTSNPQTQPTRDKPQLDTSGFGAVSEFGLVLVGVGEPPTTRLRGGIPSSDISQLKLLQLLVTFLLVTQFQPRAPFRDNHTPINVVLASNSRRSSLYCTGNESLANHLEAEGSTHIYTASMTRSHHPRNSRPPTYSVQESSNLWCEADLSVTAQIVIRSAKQITPVVRQSPSKRRHRNHSKY
jgi:hypothetical protein